MGPSCGSFWCVVGLRGLCLGSFSVSFGALVAFGVRVLRDVVDFSCHGGQVEAFRGVLEAFGGHFGAQKLSKTIEKKKQSSTKQETAQQAVSGQCSATQSKHEQRRAKHGTARQRAAKHRKSTYST